MALDKQALLAAIDAGRERSYGTDDTSELGKQRAAAIDYYLGANTNPAPEGRSQVVDRAVYETIHVVLPSLVRIFAGSSEEVCKAVPVGKDDEQGAEQQTAVLNHFITQKNQWEQICADWIHDALLLNNGYCMAYWDESKTLVREVYEGQSDDQVAALLSDKGVSVVEHSQALDKQATADAQAAFAQAAQQWQMMAQQAQAQGMQPPPPPEKPSPVYLHDLVIERAENEGKVCIRVLPPEHCHVSQDTPDWTLGECPYFEFRQEKTIAELQAMGLEVPADVSDDETATNEEDNARDRFGEDREIEGDGKGIMRRVWARMIWIRGDFEGDGQSRLYYVIAVGRTILFAQPTARIPVASLTAQPLPHRHIGMSLAETVMDLQDIGTAITRGGLDNLYLANNGRHAVSDRVNVADFLDSRPGGVIRMIDGSLPAEGHILPITHPFAFDQIIGSLEYFDQKRQNRTGASRYFSGTDAGAINKTAAGTMALQNMASMRVEHIARMMAPGFEALFSAVQEIIQKHHNKAVTVQLRGGEWVTVDPQAWRTKRDIRISVGVGAGNKDSMLAQLQLQMGAQMQLAPFGIAGPQEIYETAMEISKLQGYANPAKFWKNPAQQPPQPQQPSPDQIKAQTTMQVKQMELQADAQKFQAEWQMKMQQLQAENERKMAEMRAQLEVQAQNDQRDAERQAADAVVKAQMEQQKLDYQRAADELQAQLEKYKADLDAQTRLAIADKAAAPPVDVSALTSALDRMYQHMDRMFEHMSAPSEIVRGPDGRAVGVRKVINQLQ